MAKIDDAAIILALAEFGAEKGAPEKLIKAARRLAERAEGRPRTEHDLSARRTVKRRWQTAAAALVAMGVIHAAHAETLAQHQCRLFRQENPQLTAQLNVACIRPGVETWFTCPGLRGSKAEPVDAIYFAKAPNECATLDGQMGG